MTKINLPNNDIAEITLIGTGGGYGESCVIHLGEQNWIVVDSCINPNSKASLPLEYLNEIGVDVSNNVKLIICTHWHDDHILGISELLDKCKSSKFVVARALDRVKFLRFVSLDYKKIEDEVSISSTVEFNKCIEIVRSRGVSLIQANQDRVLYKFKIKDSIIEIISLSPSDYTIEKFDGEISSLISEYGRNKKVIMTPPNLKSIVLYLKLSTHRALLGADMEVGSNSQEGWINILDNCITIDKKSTYFKIPHHGSENGYHNRIWLELMEDKPISNLTPWNRNSKLPSLEMLKKLSKNSPYLYMTSKNMGDKPKKRDKSIEKMLVKLNYKLVEIKYQKGLIRNRIELNTPDAKWETSLFDYAFHVNPFLDNG
jgi:beta-lactamase superfamily II metal-dependent hydrolase